MNTLQREQVLAEALRRLLAAQGGEWSAGNVYIRAALAAELNAAIAQARAALAEVEVRS